MREENRGRYRQWGKKNIGGGGLHMAREYDCSQKTREKFHTSVFKAGCE